MNTETVTVAHFISSRIKDINDVSVHCLFYIINQEFYRRSGKLIESDFGVKGIGEGATYPFSEDLNFLIRSGYVVIIPAPDIGLKDVLDDTLNIFGHMPQTELISRIDNSYPYKHLSKKCKRGVIYLSKMKREDVESFLE